MVEQMVGKNADVMAFSQPAGIGPAPGSNRDKSGMNTHPIRYTRTAVFHPDPDVLRRNRVLTKNADQKVMRAYKLLRTQVLQKLQENDWNSLAVVTCRSNQGATLTAINLAISIAMDPRFTVLLVDMNLRSPAVHKYFGFEPSVGIADVTGAEVSLEDVLINPGIDGMLILPGAERIADSSEMLNSKKMMALVGEIKSKYRTRIIVFDLPGVLDADDAIAFLPYFDAGLLVLSERKTHNEDIERVLELISEKPMLGSVLNDAPA